MSLSLPIISVASYLNRTNHNDEERLATSATLHRACVEYGFFYLDISSFVPKEETDELERLAHRFFQLPQEVKDQISIENQDLARGYQRLKQNITMGKADNHEGIDLYRPVEHPDNHQPLWGENQWPSVDGFRSAYEAWINKMKALGMIVMEAMAVGLGMSDNEWGDLKGKVDDSFWCMRIIGQQWSGFPFLHLKLQTIAGYPPLPANHDGFSCGAHKDYGCLTFLHADSTPNALQVFIPKTSPAYHAASAAVTPSVTGSSLPHEEGSEDGVWLNADPQPGSIVCNIGEMWEIWSRGLYRSTLHRVIHRGANYRVSTPFFFEPNYTSYVAPLPAAARAWEEYGHKLAPPAPGSVLSEPVVYGNWLRSKVTGNFEIGKGRYD
ncbi:Clavaminate synthase-like protein [Auriculariales sp. MPI-PUGE-AT-0066]|nr:Clavaminate synthase-like protein [Auriculariales sp. MPI-PUGE-AT-0066]